MEKILIEFGEFLALVSGVCYASASIAVAKSAADRGGDNGALLSIIVTALAALGVFLLSGFSSQASSYWNLPGLGWFALSGLLTIVLGRALYFRSIAAVGPVRASAVNRLNPFFSVILATSLLGEQIKPVTAAGMLLIGASFVLLARQAIMLQRAQSAREHGSDQGEAWTPFAYAFGTASALAYATGYIARKLGLTSLPDSNFGTFVGASSGLIVYLLIALFLQRYRAPLGQLFSHTTRYHVMAAIFISAGQIAQFGAIKYIEVSRVVMLTSVEIFVSMVLSIYLLNQHPDRTSVGAAVLTTLGVVLISIR